MDIKTFTEKGYILEFYRPTKSITKKYYFSGLVDIDNLSEGFGLTDYTTEVVDDYTEIKNSGYRIVDKNGKTISNLGLDLEEAKEFIRKL